MKITLFAHGTLGDVAPLVAIAVALRNTGGHQPVVVAPEDFREFVTKHGVAYVSSGVLMKEILERVRMFNPRKVLLQRGVFAGREVSAILAERRGLMTKLVESTRETVARSDLLVFNIAGRAAAAYHAATLGIPAVAAMIAPLRRTATQPHIVFPQVRLGATLNRFSHSLVDRLTWSVFRKDLAFLERARRAEPVSWDIARKIHRADVPLMGLWSPHVFPHPRDWPQDAEVVGHPFLEVGTGWQPSATLAAFLDAGPPPVYVGFGSIGSRSPKSLADMVRRALAKVGVRGVMLTGWSGLAPGDSDATVFVADQLPHEWLFPRMAAVVHHCGCGTSHTGMRAGVPTVPTPVTADQPFWAHQMYRLGVASRPIPRSRLTADRLARAIDIVLDDQRLRKAAAELGYRIHSETPALSAIRFLERLSTR